MIEPQGEGAEELLASLLAGDRTESDPEVAELLQRRPELRAELAAMRAITARLASAANERSQALSLAQAGVTPADIEVARRAFHRSRPRHRRWRPWVVWAAACVVGIGLAVALWERTPKAPAIDNPLLGPERDQIELSPSGRSQVETFRWRRRDGAPLVPRGGSLKVVIWQTRDGKRTKLFEEPELSGDHWQPSPEQIDTLRRGGEFWWELRAVELNGETTLQAAEVQVIGLLPGPTPPAPVASLRTAFAALATANDRSSSTHAQQQLAELIAGSEAASWQHDPAPVMTAIDDGRRLLGDRSWCDRAFYEYIAAMKVEELGHREAALALLNRQFGSDPPADAADRLTLHRFAVGALALAQRLHAKGQFDAALAGARRVQGLVRGQIKHDLVEALYIEARVWIDLGVLDAAWLRLADGQRVLGEIGPTVEHDTLALACIVEAEFHLAQDQLRSAIRAIDRYEPTRPHHPRLARMRCVVRLAAAELAGRIDADAAAAEQELRRTLDQGDVGADAHEGRVMLLRAALLQRHFDVARRDLEVLRGLSIDGAERLRWRGAAEVETLATRLLLLSGAGDAELRLQAERHRSAVAQLLADWRTKHTQPSGIGFLAAAYRRQILTEFIRLIARLDPDSAPTTAFDLLSSIESATSLARGLAAPVATIDQVRSVFVRDDACVLAFLGEPNGSLVLAIEAQHVQLFALPGTFDIESRVGDLLAALAARTSAPESATDGEHVLAMAEAVAAHILTPELRQFLARFATITIADHGMLVGLPWEVLPWDDATLFGERFAVNTMTSLPAGVVLAQKRLLTVAPGSARMHLVATLLGAPDLTHAEPGAARDLTLDELSPLTRPYAAGANLLLANGDATKQRVLREIGGANITHFLAHGGVRAGEATGLALTPGAEDDGLLCPGDTAQMAVSGVILLSACGVGRAQRRIGDDPLQGTLGGAFLLAGAHTIVQSAVGLRLRTQLRLLARAHEHIAAGRSPADALRRSRCEAAKVQPETRLEVALVQVFGLGHKGIIQ